MLITGGGRTGGVPDDSLASHITERAPSKIYGTVKKRHRAAPFFTPVGMGQVAHGAILML